jgi:2,3-bisphosphoglycerate-independent phosphoglycerate mutase
VLFGYDPIRYQVGRGVLSALGIGFDLKPGDVAARGNFCTVDAEARITDRRAGRIATEVNRNLCEKLRRIRLDPVRLFIETVKEYRFLIVLRGEGLGADIDDTDPQQTGTSLRPAEARSEGSKKSAALVRQFVNFARETLSWERQANMVLLRGFSQRPQWPPIVDAWRVRSGPGSGPGPSGAGPCRPAAEVRRLAPRFKEA